MDSEQSTVGGRSRPGFSVPWGALSISLLAITVASLGTLITVVSIKNVDTLSVVALALAVLAFAAQLIVSLAQASAGAQQVAQTERVNADTQSALSELRATSNSLLANQKDLFGHVLRAALPEVARELSDEAEAVSGSGQGLTQAEIEARLEEAVSKVLGNIDSRYAHLSAQPKRSPVLFEISRPMGIKERDAFLRRMSDLSDAAKDGFSYVVSRLIDRMEKGLSPRAAFSISPESKIGSAVVELEKKGLLSVSHKSPEGKAAMIALTSLGIDFARATRDI